ncbi:MAG TPA: DUF542 domain-containing protein [Candidatus Binatia bacterium]|nr:DUF542 domain-containing protein [Candidatus Binatia bacterium]
MAHACSCHDGAGRTPVPPEPTTLITADDIVGDVARGCPGALDAMKRMGINHCCGAELTLAQAAASAGVPVESLVEALNRREPAPA